MPTGYTAKLMETGQSFSEFVMGCARAFGALIMMRDDPTNDAPIPEKFEPSNYHIKALEKAREEQKRLQVMNDAEKITFGQVEKDAEVKRAKQYLEQVRAENRRLDDMERQVRSWIPPTPDHEGLRDFMLQQLGISKNKLEYSLSSWAETQEKSAMAYYDDAVSNAEHDIEYHTKENVKEIKQADDRTDWVRQLRASLKE